MQPPQTNVLLKDYSTMRLGGPAKYLMNITSATQIGPAIDWAEAQKLPVIMVGGGSNIIWTDAGFPGLVLVNKIAGFEVQDQGEQSFITVGAGESWDKVVLRTIQAGLAGIEALSLIPGTAGATPIQNVGAYGAEISSTLVCVQAYDRTEKKLLVLDKTNCGFGYRTSRFKAADKGRFFITSITLSLTKVPPFPPYYVSVEKYLHEHNIKRPSSAQIREAVIAIRMSKLPDPDLVPNCGSFFHNPVIPLEQFEELRDHYPSIPSWHADGDKMKISAGWLLEKLGLKGYHEPNTGMATWDKQALVFVNESATSTAQLLAFRDAIIAAVQKKFGITLVQEPELVDINSPLYLTR